MIVSLSKTNVHPIEQLSQQHSLSKTQFHIESRNAKKTETKPVDSHQTSINQKNKKKKIKIRRCYSEFLSSKVKSLDSLFVYSFQKSVDLGTTDASFGVFAVKNNLRPLRPRFLGIRMSSTSPELSTHQPKPPVSQLFWNWE